MTQRIFDLIDAINREGLDNSKWAVYDLEYASTSSREFLGTREDMKLGGRLLVVYVNTDDTFCFLRPETADFKLTIDEYNDIYLWSL